MRRLDPRITRSGQAALNCALVPVAFVMLVGMPDALAEWVDLLGNQFAHVTFERDFEPALIMTTGLVVGWGASDLYHALRRIWGG